MTSIRIVFSTVGNEVEAHRIATRLVEERLAACVNIIPNVTSVYKWKGKVEKEHEILMIIKTRTEKIEALRSRLVALHPYEVPECVVLPVEAGHAAYLDWVAQETAD